MATVSSPNQKKPLISCLCSPCKKEQPLEGELKICGGCRRVAYCSKAHQVEDWPFHRNLCKAFSKIPLSTDPEYAFDSNKPLPFEVTSRPPIKTEKDFLQETGFEYQPLCLFNKRIIQDMMLFYMCGKDGSPVKKKSVAFFDSFAQKQPNAEMPLKYDPEQLIQEQHQRLCLKQVPYGFGVYAKSKIPKGEAACYFGGLYGIPSAKEPADCLYSFGLHKIQSGGFIGLGAYINDGFPNVWVKNEMLMNQAVAFSLEDILPGEQLFASYSPRNPVKLGYYAIDPDNYVKMQEYCKQMPSKVRWLRNVESNQDKMSAKDLWEAEAEYEKIQYIFGTIPVLANLILDRSLQVGSEKWRGCFSYFQDVIREKSAQIPSPFYYEGRGYQDLIAFLNKLKDRPEEKKLLKKALQELTVEGFMNSFWSLFTEETITPHLIEERIIFGKLRDQLKLMVDGSWTYSYRGSTQQFPQITTNLEQFKEDFLNLAPPLKQIITDEVANALEVLEKGELKLGPDQPHPKEQLQNLQNLLISLNMESDWVNEVYI